MNKSQRIELSPTKKVQSNKKFTPRLLGLIRTNAHAKFSLKPDAFATKTDLKTKPKNTRINAPT
jgi:hypothetical protein